MLVRSHRKSKNQCVLEGRPLKILTLLSMVLAGCGHVPTRDLGDEQARRVTPTKLRDDEIVREFRSWLDQLAQKDEFSGTVLLAKGTALLFEHAYEFADRAAQVPNK